MQFDIIHIILAVLIIIQLVIVLVLYSNLKNKNKETEKRVEQISIKFEEEKIYLEKEIKRQQYIIENYKQKNGSNRNMQELKQLGVQKENELVNKDGGEAIPIVSAPHTMDDEEFREKNKKLWELSIAIHKEKERIDKLRVEIEHRHEEVTKSINYAKRIQKALLPSAKILGMRFTDYFVYWKPKDIVSGDFYWFKRLEDRTVVVVADCTGHGVPGAFMSLLGISFLDDVVSKDHSLKSYQILSRLREMIKMALHQELRDRTKATDGIDMALCIINHKTMEIDYAGANNPIYLIRDNKISIFSPNRNPIGIHPNELPFTNLTYQLKKSDKLYMFSDGYIDQFGGDIGRKFLKRNFQRLLQYISEQNMEMEDEKAILEEAFQHWKGTKHPQIDDILVLGIKI